MSKHTPGPWKWRVGKNPSCALVGSDGKVILEAVGVDGMESDDDLIAAAPELLGALIELCDAGDEAWGEGRACVRIARAAIAKATGETP